jgi:hypothetical protein
MRVLFVASNPKARESLALEREITELQRRSLATQGDPVEFVFLPELPLEQFPLELSKQPFDVLHISAHGASTGLSLANSAGNETLLTAEMLNAFLDVDRPPRLVYVSACHSEAIARALISRVSMAIGTTATVKNRAARSAAVLFYARILEGKSVQSAFTASRELICALENKAAKSKLFAGRNIRPEREFLHQVPRLVAKFSRKDGRIRRYADGAYYVDLGVIGCPQATAQIIFFTDDQQLADDPQTYEEGMSVLTRDAPARGEVWIEEWDASWNLRFYACGVTSRGESFVVESMLCEALELYTRLTEKSPADAAAAIVDLRKMDGAELARAHATTRTESTTTHSRVQKKANWRARRGRQRKGMKR